MRIKLKQQYMVHPPGSVVDFPPPICDLLIRRGIASAVEEKQARSADNKSMAHRAKARNK